MRKIISFLLIISIFFSLSICLSSCAKRENKAAIFKLVEQNKSVLLEDIQNNNFERSKRINKIRDIYIDLDNGWINYGYKSGDNIWIGFYYEGFLYVENNDIFSTVHYSGMDNHPDYDITIENDTYTFREKEGGGNYFYVEKICDQFYYYYEKY